MKRVLRVTIRGQPRSPESQRVARFKKFGLCRRFPPAAEGCCVICTARTKMGICNAKAKKPKASTDGKKPDDKGTAADGAKKPDEATSTTVAGDKMICEWAALVRYAALEYFFSALRPLRPICGLRRWRGWCVPRTVRAWESTASCTSRWTGAKSRFFFGTVCAPHLARFGSARAGHGSQPRPSRDLTDALALLKPVAVAVPFLLLVLLTERHSRSGAQLTRTRLVTKTSRTITSSGARLAAVASALSWKALRRAPRNGALLVARVCWVSRD